MKLTITAIRIATNTADLKMKLKLSAVSMNTDKIIAGSVNKSPKAAIIGLVILSGSQPCSKLLNETSIVIGSIIIFEITPAITLIKMKSIRLIESWLNKIHRILATIPKKRDSTSVKTNDENML